MDALMEGTLVRHERCLYTEVNGRRGPLLIWPHGFSYREQGPDVVILDDDGEAVGGTGKRISMAGGLVPLRLLTTRLRAEAGKCTNRPSVWLVSGL